MSVIAATTNLEPLPSKAGGLAFDVQGVTVAYRSYKDRPTSLKESIIRVVRQRTFKHYSTFNALHNVSIQIPRGEVFGIIGSNGSGKSTLLKVLARVLKPTQGKVRVNGSVSSLIQLGAGFDHELNAVENIYLNGSLHKKSIEHLKQRIPHILEFAELGEFASTPIKYYSSGMYARLGFSAAIDIDPDIFIVDEILSVGDERFQNKCKKVLKDFIDRKRTIVIVTHDMNLLADIATSCVLLSRGEIVASGAPSECIKAYRESQYQSSLG